MADIKISELSSASILQDADNLELSQDISGTLQSTKVSLLALGNKLASNTNYTSALKSVNKTLTGAINEKVDWVSNGYLGAKNLNSYPYYESNHTDRDVVWTDNGDGTVTANGKASGGASSFICHNRISGRAYPLILPNGKYFVSGCPASGSDSTYRISAYVTKNGSASLLGRDYGDGVEIEVSGDDYYNDKALVQIGVDIITNYTANNLTFKPMITLVADTDRTWREYAPTNKELYDMKPTNESIAQVEVSPTSTNHAQGDYIMYNRQLYKCLTAITSGSNLVVGTNIQATNVVSEMGGGSGGILVSDTLTAGQTSITLNNANITTSSWISPYTSIYGVNPTNVVATTGSVTLTFEAQLTDILVGVEVK